MTSDAAKNADRFLGFAELYEQARPAMPDYPIHVIIKYLGRIPEKVIDLGCGTGLSTFVCANRCGKVIGIEPNAEMLAVASAKQTGCVSFYQAFSHETGVEDNTADAAICSQSFHWMEPFQTLREVNRVLKPNGVFATVDCDWPPVCGWQAEKAYNDLFHQVELVEQAHEDLKDSFKRWDKSNHLQNIQESGYFRFAREIVFFNTEKCTADRLIALALSQGGLQNILKTKPELITAQVEVYKTVINEMFGNKEFEIDFCYRMRLGVK